MSKISRRQFLRGVGGVTFLALVPAGCGKYAAAPSAVSPATGDEVAVNADASGKTPVLFSVLPYIQPGAGSTLVAGEEAMVLAWQTEAIIANFEVVFGTSKSYGSKGEIARSNRWSGDEDDGENRYNYVAQLSKLELGKRYFYRVSCDGQIIMEGFFTTRRPRGEKIRFAAFGDNSYGDISDRAIAYQAHRANPDFVMNTGDNVYDGGLDGEYSRFFFPVYNSDVAGPHLGAPLLRSVPFYTVIANHDVHDKLVVANHDPHDKTEIKRPVADFDKNPDSLGFYTAMHLPLNGPSTLPHPPPTIGDPKLIGAFKRCAGERFPRMANYSFDYGDAHFLCLDSNIYVDPTHAALQSWIEKDLAATDALWKFVVYHHPAFNVGDDHYKEQHMRVLMPLWEKHNVDFVLNGHEHTYQRAQPIRFTPTNIARAKVLNTKDRLVPGTWKVDKNFDGEKNTIADGVLHIVTGAGGKHLYDPYHTNNPTVWKHPEDGNIEYVTKFMSDSHSLSIFEIEGKALTLKQVDQYGGTIDAIRVTKA